MEFKKITKNRFTDNLFQLVADVSFFLIRLFYQINSTNSQKVLIISLHKIGDSIFTIPSIKFLLDEMKKNEIFLLVYSGTEELFNGLVDMKNILTIEQKEFKFSNRIASGKARKIIRDVNPGMVIDLTCTITSAFLIFNSKAKKIVGANDKYFKNIYSDFSIVSKSLHLINMYASPVENLLRKTISEDYFEYPLLYRKDGIILIHPFAGWVAKEWGLKNYLLLLKEINKNYNATLIFYCDETDKLDIKRLEEENIRYIQLNSLKDLIKEVKNCSLFIGNDSGPLYIANYFGKPTFTIYGPTNPAYSKPFGNFHRQIRKEIECSPNGVQYCYLSAGRKCPTIDCMKLLDVQLVFEKVIEFIKILGIENYKIN